MSKKRIFIFILTVACLGFGLSACQRSDRSNPVVVRFDGGSLTREDLEAHYRKMKKASRFRKDPGALTPAYAFEHAVNMEMIIAEGLKEKLHLDPRIRAEIHSFMADLFLKVLQDRLVPKIDKKDFSEKEVRAYFDAHPESYQTPALYDVHIIKVGDKAVLDRILTGIADDSFTFQEAARTFSTDARTRNNGGAVGKRELKHFPSEWREIIADLRPGMVSEPTAIDGNWFLFKLADKKEPVPLRYEDKKDYIRNDLLYARYQEAWQAAYDRLKQKFSLEVNDVRLEAFLKGGDRT